MWPGRVKSVLDEAGRIDILVNNAGFGISGAVEFTDLATARRQWMSISGAWPP